MAATLNDVRNLGDSLRQYNFELVIPNVPGGGDGDILRLHVISTTIPGLSSEMIERSQHGFTIKEAGRGNTPRSLACEFFENSDLVIFRMLQAWHKLQWDPQTGAQAQSSVYKTKAYLKVLGNDRSEKASILLEGLCIEDIPDIAMSGESSEQARVAPTFSYDNWDFDN